MHRSQCFKRAKPASWAAEAPPFVALPMPSSDLSRNQLWESVKCMVLSLLWLSLCLDRNSQAAKLCVNQLHFVASLILPKTNPSCKSMACCPASEPPWMLSPQRQHLPSCLQCIWWYHSEPGNGAEVPKIAKIAKFEGGGGASKIQKPMIHLYQHNLTEAAWSAWAVSLLPESVVSSSSPSTFTFGAGVFFCISAKRVSWKPGISGCKTVHIPYIVKQSRLVSCLLQWLPVHVRPTTECAKVDVQTRVSN